ncbi:MAG: DsrE family protein [Promethearchaeota archaeon]
MDKVFLILSSGDIEVHQEVTFRFTLNAFKKGWMDQVRVILWGPTERMAVENEQFRDQVKLLITAGVEVYACKACSDNLGLSDKLSKLGIKVEHVGELTTHMLKEGWQQLTF